MTFDYDAIDGRLGMPGRMISGSKTVPTRLGGHEIYWNACVFAKDGDAFKQVWYGDVDVTVSSAVLSDLAQNLDTTLVLTQEHPFRWDGYQPGVKGTRPIYEFNPLGGVTKYD